MSTVDISNLQQVSSYSTILEKNNLTNHVYYLDVTDTSGYVFEIAVFDTSGTLGVDPTFDTAIQQDLGLEDVDAIAVLDVSLQDFNSIFVFQSDSDDLDDLSVNDLKFGLNSSAMNLFSDTSFSFAEVVENKVNTYYSDQNIHDDYVRNLAYQITGGYSAADIFSNEEGLVQGVKDLDPSFQETFNNTLNTLILDTSNNGTKSLPEINNLTTNSTVFKSAIALLTINLNSSSDSSRLNTLFTDIAAASAAAATSENNVGPITVPIRFHSGDKIALRIVYKSDPYTTPFGEDRTIQPRSYKVILNLV